jgi:hypothetical protein
MTLAFPDLVKDGSPFLTAGVNIDEILVDFLEENSSKFKNFKVLEQNFDQTTINF